MTAVAESVLKKGGDKIILLSGLKWAVPERVNCQNETHHALSFGDEICHLLCVGVLLS